MALSWDRLPYGFHDLGYLFSLERGISAPKDWVHPLFLPLLGGLRGALSALGSQGSLLMPLELGNLAVSLLALAGAYFLAASLSGRSSLSAIGTILLAFSPGFWEGALRPDPYAGAAACVLAAFGLLAGRRPARPALRYALAGAAAGLAAGLHLSGLALVPAAAAAAHGESGSPGRRAGLLGAFAGAFALVLLGAYALFMGVGWGSLEAAGRTDPAELFLKVEQSPLSSLYTSRNLAKQFSDWSNTVSVQGGPALLAFGALSALLLAGRWGELSGRRKIAVRLAAAHGMFFSIFFLINNSHNGFVYAALLPVPAVLALAPGPNRAIALLLVPLGAVAAAAGAASGLSFSPDRDPILPEARYLARLLRRGDLLVAESCPPLELSYLKRFDALREERISPGPCEFPGAREAELPGRISERLSRGGRVYVRAEDGLRERLSPRFSAECRFQSPAGRRYCRLQKKGGGPPASLAASAAGRRGREALRRVLARGKSGGDVLRRADYLIGWLDDSPDDAAAAGDLTCAVSDWLGGELDRAGPRGGENPVGRLVGDTVEFDAVLGQAEAMRRSSKCRAEGPGRRSWADRDRVLARWKRARGKMASLRGEGARGFLAAESRSSKLVEEGVALYRAGRAPEARERFQAAADADGENPSAWLSLGAVLAVSGRHAEALACYEEILSRGLLEGDPLADTLGARANSLAALGRAAEARRERREALRIASPSWPSRLEISAFLGR